jgi:hypothetical protein
MAALGATLAACDSLIGLGQYSVVPCDADCPGADSSGNAAMDAGDELDASTAPFDSTVADVTDASDASDVTVVDGAPEAAPITDASFEASPVTLWAQWPMPNPDAAIAPGADAMLPNQMSYEINGDGGAGTTVTDLVTKLTWLQAPPPSGTCPAGFHVPTRIQLVSLIDFTQQPTIDRAAFPQVVADYYRTSSIVMADGGPTGKNWSIDFSSGQTSTIATPSSVLCLQDGP